MGTSAAARFALTICIFLFLLFIFAPGGMSYDSFVQYVEAQKGMFSDWHPPVMALVWRYFLPLYDGPLPMLCFHLLMLTTACLILSSCKTENGLAQWLWLLIPLFPFVIGIAGMIWKDVGMAYSFFLSFALFHKSKTVHSFKKRFFLLAGAGIFFSYGFLVRANAVMAAAPVVYYLLRMRMRIHRSIKCVFLLTCIVCTVLLAATYVINQKIFHVKKTSPTQVMKLDEIAATSHIVGKNLFSPRLKASALPMEDIPRYQWEKGWNFYAQGNHDINALEENWLSVMMSYPVEYIKAKLSLIRNFCSFPLVEKHDAFTFFMEKHDNFSFLMEKHEFLFSISPNKWRDRIQKYVSSINKRLLFPYLPIFWIPLAAIIFYAGLCRRDTVGFELRLLTASAICYFFGYFLVTPTPDYRFIYWTVLGTTAAFFVRWYAPKTASTSERAV
jgi:hypothetical protein